MGEPIDNLYFNWLCAKVLDGSELKTRYNFLVILHKTEFVWVVSGDRHRVLDTKDLRDDFFIASGLEPDPNWETEQCSVLEIFISLAQRLNFQTGASVYSWFWEFIENLGLNEYIHSANRNKRKIEEILDIFIWRQYEPDGRGGIFPLVNPQNDQRKIELWYQYAEYATERALY
jgi:hypothetical protein